MLSRRFLVNKISKMALCENLTEIRNEYGSATNTEELLTLVNELIPLKKKNVICVNGTAASFKSTIECNLRSDDDIDSFIKDYNEKTSETLRKLTPKTPGNRSLYKKIYYFRCHHKTRYSGTKDHITIAQRKATKRFKNTDCPFYLCIKLPL